MINISDIIIRIFFSKSIASSLDFTFSIGFLESPPPMSKFGISINFIELSDPFFYKSFVS